MNNKTIEKDLEGLGYKILDPFQTLVIGFCLTVILFITGMLLIEKTIMVFLQNQTMKIQYDVDQWVILIIMWIPRLALLFFLVIFLWKNFFVKGREKSMEVGTYGVLRWFGKVSQNKIYATGEHWSLPFKGFGMEIINMKVQKLCVDAIVYSNDKIQMKTPMNLSYRVYDPVVFINIEDFKDNFEAMINNAFVDISNGHDAEGMLGLSKTKLLEAVKEHLEKIPPSDDYRISDFGIEILENTIAIEGFDFLSKEARQAYEAPQIEAKRVEAQKIEWEGFLARAKEVEMAQGISGGEALLRIMQKDQEKLPDEKVINIPGLFSPEIREFLLSILNSQKTK